MKDFSFLNNATPDFIDSMYTSYLKHPEQLDASWLAFFKGFDYSKQSSAIPEPSQVNYDSLENEFKVYQLIQAFRSRGHLLSDTNPIRKRKDRNEQLDLKDFGLGTPDLNVRFAAGKEINLPNATLSEILAALRSIYCSKIGFEFTYIESVERRNWFQQKIESNIPSNDYDLNLNTKKRGRPRKSENTAEQTATIIAVRQPEPVAFVEQKRKRGRPPKNQTANGSS